MTSSQGSPPITSSSSAVVKSRRDVRSALRLRANIMTQLSQIIGSTPNRGTIVYTLGKELLLVLRCLPLGVLNKVTPTTTTQFTPLSSSNSEDNNSSSKINNINSTSNYNNEDGISSSSSSSSSPSSATSLSSTTLSSSSTTTDNTNNIFTDLLGKATFAAWSLKDRVLKNPSLLQRNLDLSTTTSNYMKDLTTTTTTGSSTTTLPTTPKKVPEQIITATTTASPPPPSSNQSDESSSSSSTSEVVMDADREIKQFLNDMTTEWRSIEARARYLVLKLISVVNDSNSTHLIYYIEDLYNHLAQYKESRIIAVESGAIKTLQKIIKLNREHVYLVHCARETLGLLGCNPPVKGFGIKVLSIDGGGVRGLVAIEVLRKIEKMTGKRIHELFDYICGVSTGSILAFLIGAHRRTLDECEVLYKQLSREIFNQPMLIGAGSLFWSHSYYNTAAWEKILRKHIGEHDLMFQARDPDLPRVSAISTIVSHERVSPYVFRTYTTEPGFLPSPRYSGGNKHKMWEAVRASAAAPTYFEEIKLGNTLHQDGGVLVNNPTSVALSEAKTIWQGAPLQCILSLGCGQTFSSRCFPDPNLSDLSNPPNSKSPNSLSWKGKFLKVLDSATDTESVHYTLMELLPKNVYFRFNPHLTEMLSMDETKPHRLEQVQRETNEYLIRNVDKLNYCCEMLTREKTFPKKIYDWWSYQK